MIKLSIAALVMLSATVAQAAAYTEQYNYKGNGADGSMSTCGECGCQDLSFSVGASKQLGPNSWSGQYGWLWFNQYDWCTGDYSYGWADLSGATFNSNGGRGATLAFSGTGTTEEFLGCEYVEEPQCWSNCYWDDINGVEVCEEYCEPGWWNCQWDYVSVPVELNATWAPTDISRGINSNQQKGSNYVARWRTVGTYGYGPVNGSASFDGFTFEGGYGSCYAATSGQAWMTHFN